MCEPIASGNFKFIRTQIDGVIAVEARRFHDERGFFAEAYKRPDFVTGGIEAVFVQENHSTSKRGVLRGLHYQVKFPQAKLVRVSSGEAFDVAVDLRPESPTFGKWHGEVLSEANGRQLYIPRGCAHGILMLSDEVVFSYKSDDIYHPEDEAGVLWSDASLAIDWPMPLADIIVSKKDAALPGLTAAVLAR